VTGGVVLVENVLSEHVRPVIAERREVNVELIEHENSIRVVGPDYLNATDVKTLPDPGFPTDMQSQMMVAMLNGNGTSMLTETVFENRFMHVEEFRRMNANMKIEGRSDLVNGKAVLKGAQVQETDLSTAAA